MEPITAPPLVVQRAGSLLAAAYTPADALVRDVEHGYRGSACASGYRLVDPCGTEEVDHGFDDDSGDTVSGNPVVVQAFEQCSAMGSRDGRRKRAADRLAVVEGPAIAREFWTGELADAAGFTVNPRLAEATPEATDINAAAAVSPLEALALLEDALADMLGGVPGVIHGTRAAITHMLDVGSIEASGDLLVSKFGTRLVGDAGYPGTGPDGTAADAGEAWLYGTARPTILLSAPVVLPDEGAAEAVDRDTNVITYQAERGFLTLLECGIVAVRIATTT